MHFAGFIALIVCLSIILAAALGFGVYYFCVRSRIDSHSHHTVSISTSSLTNTQSPPPAHPHDVQNGAQPQGRWLSLFPLSFRSKPAEDVEHARGLQNPRPQMWRKGSAGKPAWAQASSGDEWDSEDGYSQKTSPTGIRPMRMTERDSMAKSDFDSISEEATDALEALPALKGAGGLGRTPGSGSSSHTHQSRNRSKSPPGSLQRQMQMHAIESVRSLNASPEPYASTDDHHSQAGLVKEEPSEGRHFSRESGETSVSTRTSHTGTKFVEALDDE